MWAFCTSCSIASWVGLGVSWAFVCFPIKFLRLVVGFFPAKINFICGNVGTMFFKIYSAAFVFSPTDKLPWYST